MTSGTRLYKRMNTIQGKAIPVYLGSVNLNSAFYLTTRTGIVHLMLLSWAGEEGWRCGIEPERLWLETLRTHHKVAALGVQQGDLRPPNVLSSITSSSLSDGPRPGMPSQSQEQRAARPQRKV